MPNTLKGAVLLLARRVSQMQRRSNKPAFITNPLTLMTRSTKIRSQKLSLDSEYQALLKRKSAIFKSSLLHRNLLKPDLPLTSFVSRRKFFTGDSGEDLEAGYLNQAFDLSYQAQLAKKLVKPHLRFKANRFIKDGDANALVEHFYLLGRELGHLSYDYCLHAAFALFEYALTGNTTRFFHYVNERALLDNNMFTNIFMMTQDAFNPRNIQINSFGVIPRNLPLALDQNTTYSDIDNFKNYALNLPKKTPLMIIISGHAFFITRDKDNNFIILGTGPDEKEAFNLHPKTVISSEQEAPFKGYKLNTEEMKIGVDNFLEILKNFNSPLIAITVKEESLEKFANSELDSKIPDSNVFKKQTNRYKTPFSNFVEDPPMFYGKPFVENPSNRILASRIYDLSKFNNNVSKFSNILKKQKISKDFNAVVDAHTLLMLAWNNDIPEIDFPKQLFNKKDESFVSMAKILGLTGMDLDAMNIDIAGFKEMEYQGIKSQMTLGFKDGMKVASLPLSDKDVFDINFLQQNSLAKTLSSIAYLPAGKILIACSDNEVYFITRTNNQRLIILDRELISKIQKQKLTQHQIIYAYESLGSTKLENQNYHEKMQHIERREKLVLMSFKDQYYPKRIIKDLILELDDRFGEFIFHPLKFSERIEIPKYVFNKFIKNPKLENILKKHEKKHVFVLNILFDFFFKKHQVKEEEVPWGESAMDAEDSSSTTLSKYASFFYPLMHIRVPMSAVCFDKRDPSREVKGIQGNLHIFGRNKVSFLQEIFRIPHNVVLVFVVDNEKTCIVRRGKTDNSLELIDKDNQFQSMLGDESQTLQYDPVHLPGLYRNAEKIIENIMEHNEHNVFEILVMRRSGHEIRQDPFLQ